MADVLCVACSRPILPGDAKSILQQVDACTMAVEQVPYHAECWDRTAQGGPAAPADRTGSPR